MDLNASHSKETKQEGKMFPFPLADACLVCVCASTRKEMLPRLTSVYLGFAKSLTRQGRVGGEEGVDHQSGLDPWPHHILACGRVRNYICKHCH